MKKKIIFIAIIILMIIVFCCIREIKYGTELEGIWLDNYDLSYKCKIKKNGPKYTIQYIAPSTRGAGKTVYHGTFNKDENYIEYDYHDKSGQSFTERLKRKNKKLVCYVKGEKDKEFDEIYYYTKQSWILSLLE